MQSSPVIVADVIEAMESWAPSWLAEDWDRVGLMTGSPKGSAEHIWVALEVNRRLVEEAIAAGVEMILTHHPPIFSPLNNLCADNTDAALPLMAASRGVALFAAHTNLDSAPGGVNDVLGELAGLLNMEPLIPAGKGGQAKVVTFAPLEAVDPVLEAMFAAGAGRIGDYRECAFRSSGQGSYLTPEDGQPHSGEPGHRSVEEEIRLEAVAPRSAVGRVIAALTKAHPYEEPAVDVYRLEQPPVGAGLGRVGDLAREQEGEAFLRQTAETLGCGFFKTAGRIPATVNRAAVVGGSGADLINSAAAAGAQVLITGEAGHHAAETAQAAGVCLAVMGHYETEVVIVEPWARRLSRMLRQAGKASRVRPWLAPHTPWRAMRASG